MKILVSGCAGFIGSHLCETLLSLNHKVIGIDNMNNYYDVNQKNQNIKILQNHKNSNNFKFFKEDILNTNIINEYKPNIVCHLAAMAGVRYSIENPKLYADVNIRGMIHLLEQCAKNNISKFVYASSSSVYGLNKKIPFSEDDNIEKCNSPYATSKKASEIYAKLYHQLYGINLIGLRFFTVYGPRGRPDMAPFKFINSILNDKHIDKYGTGESQRDYTYISDIIDGIIKSIEKCGNEIIGNNIYNLGNNKPITLNKFIQTCEEVCGKKALINYKSNQKGDVPITYADITKAQKDLEYNPSYDIKKGLSNLKEWFLLNK